MSNTFLITAPPPTTNGDLHLGHLSGPYLHADVFARGQRSIGNQVVYLSGTDDHQSYVVTKAKNEKRSTEEVIQDYRNKIITTLEAANIKVDVFENPRNEGYVNFVQDFFLKLYNQGSLKQVTELNYYCEECDEFLFEAHIKGECPNCGVPSGGNYCEACGEPNNPLDLKNARCTICSNKPVVRELTKMVFPLERYRSQLEHYFNKHLWKYRKHLQDLISSLMERPLPDVPVTNYYNWGIPVPLYQMKGHVINVWFEMFPGHVYSAKRWSRETHNNENLWLRDSDATVIQFLGFDNSFYYVLLHQALAIATEDYKLTDSFITNKFYLLEGRKFSTSRGHAIWGREFLEKEPSDIMRFYLSYTSPEELETNFSMMEYQLFKTQIFQDLECIITSILEINKQDGDIDNSSNKCLQNLISDYARDVKLQFATESFSLSKIANKLMTFIKEIKDLSNNSLSKSDTQLILRALSTALYPVMPNLSLEIRRVLAMDESVPLWESVQKGNPINVEIIKCILQSFNSYKQAVL
jgi:methionyl-tRNA synthetase